VLLRPAAAGASTADNRDGRHERRRHQSNANSGASAVHGVTQGSGATIWASQEGTGVALRGFTTNGRGLDVFVTGKANDHILSTLRHDGTGEVQYVLQNNGSGTNWKQLA
jgi:hypothetical protein